LWFQLHLTEISIHSKDSAQQNGDSIDFVERQEGMDEGRVA
jgi:hypothetical protein